MAETDPLQKRKRRNNVSPIDAMVARERGAMEMQLRRNAVLQYVGEQLAELNALLRQAGFNLTSAPPIPTALSQTPVHQPPVVAQAWEPCTWCGGGKPTKAFNVGGGVVQHLCATHGAMVAAQQREDAKTSAQGFSVNHTDAKAQPPNLNSGRMVMQPTEQDFQQSADAPQVPEGLEEIADGEQTD